MSHPTTRVLTVLELLQSHHRITGAQLAERLEVDARTIRRYITALQELGFPVEAERGRYGAYRLMPGFKLPPLLFTEDEALAITLGLLTARRLRLSAAAPAIEGALAKVERVLPATVRSRIQAVQQALMIDIALPEVALSTDVLMTLSTAAQQYKQVQLRYRSARAEDTERLFDPYGLVYRAGRWYTAGYCHLRAGLRMFRLDRILDATLHAGTFTRPADFDCLEFVVQTLAAMPGTWSVHVLLETSLERARELVPADMAMLAERPNGVEFHCDVEDLDYIARFLAQLRVPYVVLDPPELRHELQKLADALQIAAAREPAASRAR